MRRAAVSVESLKRQTCVKLLHFLKKCFPLTICCTHVETGWCSSSIVVARDNYVQMHVCS